MLTDTLIKNTKPADKTFKITDGAGLYLEVTPSGGKHWRYRFRLDGKENLFAVGSYPDVKPAEARTLRDDAKELVKRGINPANQRKLDKVASQNERATTFEAVAAEWFTGASLDWSEGYRHHIKVILGRDINPRIGALPIKDIRTPIVHDVLSKIVKRQAPTRAILARQIMGAVFNLACISGRAEYNVVEPLKGQIARRVVEHRKHLNDSDLPDFLRKLHDYTGHVTTTIAFKLLLLTAVRPGELCGAVWSEFNREKAEWRIPKERMKMNEEHLVPLSRQALELLAELHDHTGHGKYLFPNQGTKSATMPTATLRNVVFKLGFADRFSPHGARGTFSTICNEAGFRSDVIERQLAHGERNAVRAAYAHAEYMPERRLMMQAYADKLDALAAESSVMPSV